MSTVNMSLPSRTPSNLALSSSRSSRGSLVEKGSLMRDFERDFPRQSTSTSTSSILPGRRRSTQLLTPTLANKNSFLEGYDIQEVLGMGKHGEVKRAVHIMSGQQQPASHAHDQVAIKFIANEDCPADDGKWSEVAALRRLHHPHVVRLFDVIKSSTHTMLVLECLSGGELFDYLVSRQRLSDREAQRFIRQVLSALDYCHKEGVVHRDLKLENLLLAGDGSIKITDFGFSNVFCDGGLMSTFVGSPSYAAPEIVANEKYAGPAADVWSLGVIIYTVLTGQLPFQGDNGAVSLERILCAAFTLPDCLSPKARDLISSILKRNPDERPSVQALWEHPWVSEGHQAPLICSSIKIDDSIHQKCLKEMGENGFDISGIETLLREHGVNSLTASYYLLADKFSAEKKEAEQNAEIAQMSARLLGMLDGDKDKTVRASNTPLSPFLLRPKSRQPAAEAPKERRFSEESKISKVSERRHSTYSQESSGDDDTEGEAKAVPAIIQHVAFDDKKDSVFDPTPSPTREEEHLLKPPTCLVDGIVCFSASPEDDDAHSVVSARSENVTVSQQVAPTEDFRERASTWTPNARKQRVRDDSAIHIPFRPRGATITSSVGRRPCPITAVQPQWNVGQSSSESVDCLGELPSIPLRPKTSLSRSCAGNSQIMRQLQARARLQQYQGRQLSACDTLPSLSVSPVPSPRSRRMSYKVTTLGETAETAESPHKPMFKRASSAMAQRPSLGHMQLARAIQATKAASKSASQKTPSPLSTNFPPRDVAVDSLDLATTIRAFGAATTSSMPVDDIIAEIKRALAKEGVVFEHVTSRKLMCECRANELDARSIPRASRRRSSLTVDEYMQWDMEVLPLPKLGLNGIRLHRVSGDCWKYKAKIAKIVKIMKL